jgi:signal transduction histidine kinase
MTDPRPHPGPPRWLRPPRRTARLRLTVLYGAAFLACGAAVLAVIYLVFGHTAAPGASNSPAHPQNLPTMEMTVPAAFVQQDGRYDLINVPAQVIQQLNAVAAMTPAQRARLIDGAQAQVNYDKRELLIISSVSLGVIAVLSAVIGWIIAGRVLRPLRTITAAARRISASSLHERLAMRGPDDELKELGDTLDGLFARLEASFDAQRRFAANASHELRTPLTRERTLLQVTLADPASTTSTWRAVSRELLASNAEQERLIEAMLTLASSEAGAREREPVDLARITTAALAVARPAISDRGLDVETDIQPAALDGDPLLVQQLAANLIENAIRHNIPGGDIHIATGTSDAGAVLSVSNSGPVIPGAEVDRLFQPFQRLGARPARRDGGHGLGLSIVRAIAAAHAATIEASALPGGGLAVDVTFPPPPPPQPPARRPQAGRAARVSASALRSRQSLDKKVTASCRFGEAPFDALVKAAEQPAARASRGDHGGESSSQRVHHPGRGHRGPGRQRGHGGRRLVVPAPRSGGHAVQARGTAGQRRPVARPGDL